MFGRIAQAAADTTGHALAFAGQQAQRAQDKRQWNRQFSEDVRQFDLTTQQKQAQQKWENHWNNILNNLSKQKGRQDIIMGNEAVKTNMIEQQLHRNSLMREQEAMKNFTLGQAAAFKNSNRGQIQEGFRQ